MRKVLIPTKLDKICSEVLTANGYSVTQEAAKDLPAFARANADAYALIVRSEKVTPEVIDALPKLKVIVRAGAGVDTIDTKYARRRGIDVMNTPGANSLAVAEEVIALMLADARHLIEADASTRRGEWEKTRFMGREISNKTVGIVGLGNIGRLVAKLLTGFECRLLGFDPVLSSERARDFGVDLVDLETLFAESDYVTLHIPENKETKHLVSAPLLAKMKNGATIVNCARAGIIDEAALREARQTKQIRFLNDVYPKDAEGPKSVADIADILAPHLGASTFEANFKAARRAAEELVDFDTKGVTSFIVNRDIPEGLDEAYCELANMLSQLCRCLVGKDAKAKLLETTFHGSLDPFADWLLVPVVAGLWENFDRSADFRAAQAYLAEMGIEYVNHKAEPRREYEKSITMELTAEINADNLRRVSVRGTVAEGVLMVSRINEFDRLYLQPFGHTVFFLYDDRPGVLAAIGTKLAEAGINIEDTRNPHDRKTNRSLAIMKINKPAGEELMAAIKKEIRALAAFHIQL